MLKVSGCGFICCSAALPWVQQACGLKPTHASKLIKAAEWVNMEHVPHLEGITELIKKTAPTRSGFLVGAELIKKTSCAKSGFFAHDTQHNTPAAEAVAV